MTKEYTMHVISGTHWDREWRHTAEQSKSRLMDLMDGIIELLETNPDYECFCVDGGTIVIEDYLTVRPERKQRIINLIKARRMQIIRWYTLPETFTVAPEALIRNLLVGSKMAREFGGAIDSGYTATSYGQTSQLPQIYNGFGQNTAIFYRGTNKHILTPLFRWIGADGSELHTLRTFDEVTRTNWFFYVHQPIVLGKPCRDLSYTYDRSHMPAHLCDEGLYEKAFVALHEEEEYSKDPEVLKFGLSAITRQAMPYAIGNHLLALNMEDNDSPYSLLPELIHDLDRISPDIHIVQNSLDQYMQAIISQTPTENLSIHHGELRYTSVEYGFNALLGATHSSRIKLKLLNEKTETNLLCLAEPLASFASTLGQEYPKTTLDRAWLSLLKNHAHDSICGAAVDLAHEDMLYHFSVANTVAQEVTARSAMSLYSKIDTAGHFLDTDNPLVLFNMTNQERREVVALVVDLPRVAAENRNAVSTEGLQPDFEYYDIIDSDNNRIDSVELSCEKARVAIERELDTKAIKFQAHRRRLLINAVIPANGYSTYALRFREANYVFHPESGLDRLLIAREDGLLENEFIKVSIKANGTFSMLDKRTGHLMENMHYFTDSGETGSAHQSCKPLRNTVITSIGSSANVTMLESNLLRGRFKIELTLRLPVAATLDSADRMSQTTDLQIISCLTLEKGAKFLKIKTTLNNQARDHKLCVNFPSMVKSDFVYAESVFAIEKRGICWTLTGDNTEQFFPFQPMQNFVDINNGQIGVAILNRGLREYEVKDDAVRTVAITLLRTHRAYMTATPDMIPEEYDKYTGLQSFGAHEYQYAIYPHAGSWDDGEVLSAAYNFKVDIKAVQGVPMAGELPVTGSFLTVTPPGNIMISAVKAAEDGDGILARLWNSSDDAQTIELSTILPIKQARELRIDETFERDLDFTNGKVALIIGPHKIVTVQLI